MLMFQPFGDCPLFQKEKEKEKIMISKLSILSCLTKLAFNPQSNADWLKIQIMY